MDTTPIQVPIKKINEIIKLDGVLDEPAWQNAQALENFAQQFPTDSVSALGPTQIYMAYDDENLYVAAINYATSNDFTVASLKRDYGFRENDNISLLFDTYNDKTNAYMFGMNPIGARREALISDGGRSRGTFNPNWDNKWDGESKIYDDHWICELKIPFKTIRYKAGTSSWRFNCYRNDTQCNEISSWINIPRENILMDLSYMGDLVWEEPLENTGKSMSLIPYVTTSLKRDFEDDLQMSTESDFAFGGDAKIAIGSSMNLDLTVNPDFSQVEVDQQVTNLNRFEIFFPERRQFFLENADLFSSFGASRLNPFFSRRIGVSIDTVTGNNIQNTIHYGARLTGKINEDLRVGLLNMMTASQKENDLPTFNYTVLAAEQQVFDRSNIAFLFTNKQALNTEDFGETFDTYDRVVGLEYRLQSEDNAWKGKVSYMKAISPDDLENKFSHFAQLEYNKRKFRLEYAHMLVGDGFNAEMGFIPRRDIFMISPEVTFRIFPQTEKIAQHNLSLDTRWFYKLGNDDNEIITEFGLEERNIELQWDIDFVNTNGFNLSFEYENFILLDDFDPTRIQEDDIYIAAGTDVSNYTISFAYNSDRRRKMFFRFSPLFGRYYDGTRSGFNARATLRFQPYGSIGMEVNYNHINLDDPFETADLWLLGPRLDLTFTRKIFFTSFIQYNNQLDNLSINTRFQWRFAPVSDFFIVYTDNYDTGVRDAFPSRNRALIAKLTYWLNL